MEVAPFLLGAFRWLSLFWSVEFGFSFSWLEVDLSFFGWELVLSFWCGGWPFLLEGCSSSGVMVDPFLVRVGPAFSGCGG